MMDALLSKYMIKRVMIIAQQNILLVYTFLVLKKYSSETTPLNAAQVVNYMSAEFNVSQKLDRRTIYSHFIDLQKLSECYPEHVNFTFYRKANGAAYITVDQ